MNSTNPDQAAPNCSKKKYDQNVCSGTFVFIFRITMVVFKVSRNS